VWSLVGSGDGRGGGAILATMPVDPFHTQFSRSVDNADHDEDLRRVGEVAARFPSWMEIGATGLKRSGGVVDEEFLPQLRGRKAVQVYKEMSENDPIVGALMHTFNMLLRNVQWRVEASGSKQEDVKAAKFVESCMDDMEHTWSDFVSEVLSMLVYGWSWFEVVYKRRLGLYTRDHRTMSRHEDGLIGWRKLPVRAQETLFKWVFDDDGRVRAMVQMPAPHYRQTLVPMSRSLLFRYQHAKGNPEGRSLLRNAYRPWFYKKRIEEFEAVGVERDLAGLPMVKVPAEWLRAKPGTAQHKAVLEFKKMVKSIRRDEQEGLVFPQAYDQDTKQPLFDFQLLGSGGSRAFSTDSIINRYEQRILMTVLADFILVGHQGVGSYSLHVDKTGIFRTSLNAIVDSIAEVLNRQAVPRLMRMNGMRSLPRFVPSDVDAPDIAQLGAFMGQMAGLGMSWFPDPDMEQFVRRAARMPEMTDDDKKRVELSEKNQQRTDFMNRQLAFIQAKQGLTQTLQGVVDQAAAGAGLPPGGTPPVGPAAGGPQDPAAAAGGGAAAGGAAAGGAGGPVAGQEGGA
jgi:hypothetical protein